MKKQTKKDCQSLNARMEMHKNGRRLIEKEKEHLRLLNERSDKSLHPQGVQLDLGDSIAKQLRAIFAMQQIENGVHQVGSSIFSDYAETELAKCISECLFDVVEEKKCVSSLQSLLKDYRVVRPLDEKKNSVSLQQIHSILQDNFPNSWLCVLFNMLLGCTPHLESKVITFF